MTEVLIRENFSETTHSVGNIYKKADEGMWLLCNVDGKVALVSLHGGWFYSESLSLCQGESMHSISNSTFQRICSGKRFDLVKKNNYFGGVNNYFGGVKFAKTKTTSTPSNTNPAGL